MNRMHSGSDKLSPAKQALLEKRLRMAGKRDAGEMARRVDRASSPLSFAQQRLWFLDQLEGAGTASYNVLCVWQLQGSLDAFALHRSLEEIVQRHEALRTVFADKDGKPMQRVLPEAALHLPLISLENLTPAEREPEALRLAREEGGRGFDLAKGPLLRTQLLRLAEREHVLILNLHHIVSDGWSIGVLTRELAALYEAFRAGRPSPLPALPIQYPDFADWQRQHLQGDVLARQLAYWKKQLSGRLPVLQLPSDRPRPALPSYRGEMIEFRLPQRLAEGLRALCRREGVTLFMAVLTAFKILLYRLTGQGDLLVGTPIAGRNRSGIEGLIGFFVNTLVLRTSVSGTDTYAELLKRVQQTCLDAYDHQELPYEKLVEELQPERDLSLPPLFNVMFAVQNAPMPPLRLSDLVLTPIEVSNGTVKFDLFLSVTELADGLAVIVEYSTDLFEARRMQRLCDQFRRLLEAVAAEPGRRVRDLPLLSSEERHQLLREWNDVGKIEQEPLCLHELFERQAALTPGRTALVCGTERTTYRELNDRADQLAARLRALGIGPERLVAVRMERTPEMAAALLGILKAGGAYVPLDPDYPQERQDYILEDSNASVLLTGEELILLEERSPAQEDESSFSAVTPAHRAYVIYTSGSTGRPKGVEIEHRSAFVMVEWARRIFEEEELQGVLASTSLCFDLSVFELFVPLASGGTVILAPNALHLPDLPAAGEVTLLNTVPSAVKELLRQNALPRSVRVVNLAGEPLPYELVRQLYALGVEKVYNLYGPSEDTTYSTFALMERDARPPVPIGRPIAGTQAYVLDKDGCPLPAGVPGELHLAGDGLARGYLNRPELTAERFVPNPFAEEPDARMYRTGDLVRYREDGTLDYLGRLDHQVKIRGFRIELGEIENALLGHPLVREAIVMARPDGAGEQQLAAYVATDAEEGSVVPALRSHLQERVPEYMIPSAFLTFTAFPLTPNGKIDRQALLEIQPQLRRTGGYVAPRTRAEWEMVRIWEDVLGVGPISVEDAFFLIGGESLRAVRVMSLIRQAFGVQLPLAALFRTPTVAGLCRQLDAPAADAGCLIPIQQGDGTSWPLFLVHPAMGGVLCYAPLASALGRSETIYGLQAVGFDGEAAPLASVEEMAERYLEEMRRAVPHGPYRLAGWSFGGLVAFEIARRLEAAGEQVAFLGLIDTPFRGAAGEDGGEREKEFDLLRVEYAPYLPEAAPEEELRRLIGLLLAHERAERRYVPAEPVTADLTLFHAAAASALGSFPPVTAEEWQGCTRGRLRAVPVPGDHYTLIRPPHVQTVGERMKEEMQR